MAAIAGEDVDIDSAPPDWEGWSLSLRPHLDGRVNNSNVANGELWNATRTQNGIRIDTYYMSYPSSNLTVHKAVSANRTLHIHITDTRPVTLQPASSTHVRAWATNTTDIETVTIYRTNIHEHTSDPINSLLEHTPKRALYLLWHHTEIFTNAYTIEDKWNHTINVTDR